MGLMEQQRVGHEFAERPRDHRLRQDGAGPPQFRHSEPREAREAASPTVAPTHARREFERRLQRVTQKRSKMPAQLNAAENDIERSGVALDAHNIIERRRDQHRGARLIRDLVVGEDRAKTTARRRYKAVVVEISSGPDLRRGAVSEMKETKARRIYAVKLHVDTVARRDIQQESAQGDKSARLLGIARGKDLAP